MTIYTKPAVRSTWGQTATPSDLQDPGNTYASAGWQIGLKPPRQYFNWVLNYVFNAVRYFCQAGIPDYDVTETYSANQYTRDPGGYLYLSLQNNNTGHVPSNNFGSAWANPAVNTPLRAVGLWQVPNITYLENNFLPVGTAFTAINGQLSNAQVPVGAVTQWQGSLTIAGSQVASAVAQANKLLLNGAGYATFNWSGVGGQPTWLFGSNDGLNVNVYNPSNFSVANSQALQGLSPSVTATGNSVMVRDAGGYGYAAYFNQLSGNNENGSISQVMITNGGDNFFRKAGFGYFAAALISQNGLLTAANFAGSAATNGYQKFSNGIILQWGSVFAGGNNPTQVGVTFPIAFTSQCFVAFCNTLRGTGGGQGSNFVAAKSAVGATFVFDNVPSPPNTVGGYWFAVGF